MRTDHDARPRRRAASSRRALVSVFILLMVWARTAHAQGGPPFFTNDTGTPGDGSWEINLGYMPFLSSRASVMHVPDLDLNVGVGERVQLTCEVPWLRVEDREARPQYGLGQDQLGLKWRFYDEGSQGLSVSTFPQLSVNNPGYRSRRGITPPTASLTLPIEVRRPFGGVNVNAEAGYTVGNGGPDGWLVGVTVGRDLTRSLEVDTEGYWTGLVHGALQQGTLGGGVRYKLRPSLVILAMTAGMPRSSGARPHLAAYGGMQILLSDTDDAQDGPH